MSLCEFYCTCTFIFFLQKWDEIILHKILCILFFFSLNSFLWLHRIPSCRIFPFPSCQLTVFRTISCFRNCLSCTELSCPKSCPFLGQSTFDIWSSPENKGPTQERTILAPELFVWLAKAVILSATQLNFSPFHPSFWQMFITRALSSKHPVF